MHPCEPILRSHPDGDRQERAYAGNALNQEPDQVVLTPIKISAATPYDFHGQTMTAYGGLLPAATMLEKLQFPPN